MPEVDRQRIINHLWSADLPPEYKVWAILDGARDDRIYSAVTYLHARSYCLYRGKLSPKLMAIAPYLVNLKPEDALFNYLVRYGWGDSWGIFVHSKQDAEELSRHFRRFLIVQNEQGKRLVFRYYDPRVLRVFLPTCLVADLRQIFGSIHSISVEADDPTKILQYCFTGTALVSSLIDLNVGGLTEHIGTHPDVSSKFISKSIIEILK